MKVYEGAGVVADKAGAKVLPVSIDGLQFTRLGRMKGKLPMRWFPRLAVTIMPPVDLSPDPALKLDRHQRREALGRALQDLLVDTVFRAKQTDRTLFSALLDARAKHGGGIAIAEDLAREPISYNRVLLGACILGRRLAAETKPGERVGVLLPNANGTVVTFMALQAFGRVPAMLNFSAGADAMLVGLHGSAGDDDHIEPRLHREGEARQSRRAARAAGAYPVDRGPARIVRASRQAERQCWMRISPAGCPVRTHRRIPSPSCSSPAGPRARPRASR